MDGIFGTRKRYSELLVRTPEVKPRSRAKLSNSHGRIETSHARMITIGIVWPSTSIESLSSVSIAAYSSVMSMSVKAMMRSNLLTLLTAR
jgi:hypothetical protein